MFHGKLALAWQVLTTALVLCSSNTAMAEEIGTTADGNVIYRFTCASTLYGSVEFTVDWPNHFGTHPEWDIESGYGAYNSGHIGGSNAIAKYTSKSRNGQVLKCRYSGEVYGHLPAGNFYYRYKVNRDIISCDDIAYGWKCILKASGGGGKASSSATSSSDAGGATGESVVAAQGCCTTLANPALKGRIGRVVVTFPAGAVPKGTRVAVLRDGKEVQADYGSHSWELLSGTYDVIISGKKIPNVTVKAGHDTNVKVGVLRITGAKNMRAAVLEGGQEIAAGYGGELIGLPAGSFEVQMAGQTEKVTISEGKISDF